MLETLRWAPIAPLGMFPVVVLPVVVVRGLNTCLYARLRTPCGKRRHLGMRPFSSSRSTCDDDDADDATEGSVYPCRGDCHGMSLVRPPLRAAHSSLPLAFVILTAHPYFLPQGDLAGPGGVPRSRDVQSSTLAHRRRTRQDGHAFLHVRLWPKVRRRSISPCTPDRTSSHFMSRTEFVRANTSQPDRSTSTSRCCFGRSASYNDPRRRSNLMRAIFGT